MNNYGLLLGVNGSDGDSILSIPTSGISNNRNNFNYISIDLTNYLGTNTNIFPFYYDLSNNIISPWTISGWFTILDVGSATSGNDNYLLYFGDMSGSVGSNNSMSITASSSAGVTGTFDLNFLNENNFIKNQPVLWEVNKWYFYAATFNGNPGSLVSDDFELYIKKCGDT